MKLNKRNDQKINSGNKVSLFKILVSIVLSVGVFALVVAILYGAKAAMVHFNDWRASVRSEGSADLVENQEDVIPPEGDVSPSDNPTAEDDEIDERFEDNDEPESRDVDAGDTGGTGDEPESGNADAGNTEETGEDNSQDGNSNGDVAEEDGSTSEDLPPKEEPGNVENEPKVNDEKVPAVNFAIESSTAPFYFAHFDVISNGSEKLSIPSLIIRLHGTVKTINPADLTDVVLTRDGVPIDNSVTYIGQYNSFKWGYEDVTDFYFTFAYTNIEHGTYGLTGKYKGEPFKVYEKIIEGPITDTPADVDAFWSVGWCFSYDANNNVKEVSELVFQFGGRQNTFYKSDLTELKAYLNGEEIPLELNSRVFRYYESDSKGSADTSYNLILKEPFTASGTYKVTGKYRGKDFESSEIVIP